jgi:hypothetical protein
MTAPIAAQSNRFPAGSAPGVVALAGIFRQFAAFNKVVFYCDRANSS